MVKNHLLSKMPPQGSKLAQNGFAWLKTGRSTIWDAFESFWTTLGRWNACCCVSTIFCPKNAYFRPSNFQIGYSQGLHDLKPNLSERSAPFCFIWFDEISVAHCPIFRYISQDATLRLTPTLWIHLSLYSYCEATTMTMLSFGQKKNSPSISLLYIIE